MGVVWWSAGVFRLAISQKAVHNVELFPAHCFQCVGKPRNEGQEAPRFRQTGIMSRGIHPGLIRSIPGLRQIGVASAVLQSGWVGQPACLVFFQGCRRKGPGHRQRHWIRGVMRVKPCGLSLF